MLELIFQGFVEWIYGIVLEAWEYFSSALLDIMSMDFHYLESHIAIIPSIRQGLLAVGWALLIGNLIFQTIKSMLSGLGFEGEDPKLLFARTFVFSFLLLASPQICELCLNMTSRMIDVLRMPTAVHISLAQETSLQGLPGAWLLIVVAGIVVMFNSFKLIIVMAERYFILAMLTISAPLAFATGGSKHTSDIFTGWCRMYGSMCALMVLHVVNIKMLLSVLSYVPSGLELLPWIVLVLTIVKVAKKADAIITRIGLNPAMTGDALGRSFPGTLTYIVARTAIANTTRAIGKGGGRNTAGNGQGGKGPGVPPSGPGTPNRNGPTGGAKGRPNPTSAGSGGANTQQTAAYSTSQQNTAQQESSPKQNVVTQVGGQQNSVTEQQSGGSAVQNSQSVQRGAPGGERTSHTRNTSVPEGTHRSPSHVKAPAGTSDRNGNPASAKAASPGNTGSSAQKISGASVINNGPAGTGMPGGATVGNRTEGLGIAGITPARTSSGPDSKTGTGSVGNGTAGTGQAQPGVTAGGGTRTGAVGNGTAGTAPAQADIRTNGRTGIGSVRTGPAGTGQGQASASAGGRMRTDAARTGMAGTADTNIRSSEAGRSPGTAGSEKTGANNRSAPYESTVGVPSNKAGTEGSGSRLSATAGKATSTSFSGKTGREPGESRQRSTKAGAGQSAQYGTAGTASSGNGMAESDRSRAPASVIGRAGIDGLVPGDASPSNASSRSGSDRPASANQQTGISGQIKAGVQSGTIHSMRTDQRSGENRPVKGGAQPGRNPAGKDNRPPEKANGETQGTQTVRQGAMNSTLQAREQNHISVNNPAPGTPVRAETGGVPASGGQTKERPSVGVTRSTQRPGLSHPELRSGTANTQTAPTSPTTSEGSSLRKQRKGAANGTAGIVPSKNSDITLGEPRRFDGSSPSPGATRQSIQPTQTAQQERKADSAETRSSSREKPAYAHPGTAGIAPQAAGTAQAGKTAQSAGTIQPTRSTQMTGASQLARNAPAAKASQTARAQQSIGGQALRTGSISGVSDSAGGKQTVSAARNTQKRFADKPPAGKKGAAKKSGGKKRGK